MEWMLSKSSIHIGFYYYIQAPSSKPKGDPVVSVLSANQMADGVQVFGSRLCLCVCIALYVEGNSSCVYWWPPLTIAQLMIFLTFWCCKSNKHSLETILQSLDFDLLAGNTLRCWGQQPARLPSHVPWLRTHQCCTVSCVAGLWCSVGWTY